MVRSGLQVSWRIHSVTWTEIRHHQNSEIRNSKYGRYSFWYFIIDFVCVSGDSGSNLLSLFLRCSTRPHELGT